MRSEENIELKYLYGLAKKSHDLTRRRVVLRSSQVQVWYLGDRCWRQWNDTIAIPYPPPIDMLAKRLRRAQLRWFDHHGWPLASHFVHTDGDYKLYWERVSIGYLCGGDTGIFRSANFDGITSRAIRADLRLPQPDGYLSQPGPVDAAVPHVRLGDDHEQWTMSVVGSHGYEVTVPIHPVPASLSAQIEAHVQSLEIDDLRARLAENMRLVHGMRHAVYDFSRSVYQENSASASHMPAVSTQEWMHTDDQPRLSVRRRREPININLDQIYTADDDNDEYAYYNGDDGDEDNE
ncbi:hypothetical protein AQUCO_01900121v1 [Aquilegia coerulea]|uniref:Aminotransferase-like plant mobile domain-containing protein n=1 Tax=Aquilegia coerulea TaxID=218851 RepID=A0A2G5DJ10_AQUCA|nr:hypothetical protein AQUCO_01900121v1 [Aquilegia coerulea]PIA43502.1 hypothetical protein AQUCO_01900121v1 [Aquilegia coerulea]PIA43503.1 hypothetical protein AQUCO_01900121v1 [Aquilegia coerulea]